MLQPLLSMPKLLKQRRNVRRWCVCALSPSCHFSLLRAEEPSTPLDKSSSRSPLQHPFVVRMRTYWA
ncbi:uncharacterized protein CELE_Y59A8B.24 [Caenorhabditis elegans]|uniref:Secreted protein n=1 Tax=Caenorhabditis elegans TaxID=6239 RepID=Q9NES3_CAEEL|nr:Secreted protein [Caenorhabditis elegans]CAB60942.2 Secreted protein [Caenorhabditis elegans]|eukprot:NP_001346697.1 Uncharacterized protein CELE_Y59A8B.24 [Caenorhabditis elegans]